ncbi:MAG TPA: ParA family protein [Xanthobacteraceae bacterium]|jgi:chromosome partitioning protein|nr:ParA family protein [Xanthobacteraceae bacterium]
MNVITLASRKGGAGKSTLTAHLAAYAHGQGGRCLVIDADSQGSLTLWHSLRMNGGLRLEQATQGFERVLAHAMIEGYDWVFIDTSPTMWVVVQEAIRAATLVVIPARPGFFDVAAVRDTVAVARGKNKPYAVVINAAPVKRDDKDAPAVVQSRAELAKWSVPVWSGQITNRAGYMSTLAVGSSATELGPNTAAGLEIARLWSAIQRSVDVINGAHLADVPAEVANAPTHFMHHRAA